MKRKLIFTLLLFVLLVASGPASAAEQADMEGRGRDASYLAPPPHR
jgi:hypothetical protein